MVKQAEVEWELGEGGPGAMVDGVLDGEEVVAPARWSGARGRARGDALLVEEGGMAPGTDGGVGVAMFGIVVAGGRAGGGRDGGDITARLDVVVRAEAEGAGVVSSAQCRGRVASGNIEGGAHWVLEQAVVEVRVMAGWLSGASVEQGRGTGLQ
jgi:hypothetical protein